jgi:hypothetical protein
MIIWGGFGPAALSIPEEDTNPDSDSRTGTSTTNAPSVRSIHTAVWTGSEMIVWGGSDNSRLLTRVGDTILTRTVGQPPTPPTRRKLELPTLQSGPAA